MSPAMLALLPQEVIAATIIVLLLADAFVPDGRKRLLAPLAAAGVVVALAAALLAAPGPANPRDAALFNGTVAVDAFALFFEVLLLGVTLLALMLAPAYLDRRGVQRGEFYILLVAALMGMMVLVSALNLMTVFVGVELLSIPLYILSAFLRGEERSQEAGLKYLLIGGFASGFLLFGMALLYGATGTTSLARIGAAIHRLRGDELLFALTGIGLLLTGLAFKASAAPFHAWTPDVYEGAPAPVVAFMSVGTKVAAVAAFLRVFAGVLHTPLAAGRWTVLLGAVAVVSMLVGATGALRQGELKRLLAYSSVAQAGYLLLAVVANSQPATTGGLFFLAAYAAMTFGAFAVVTLLAGADDRVPVEGLRGLGYSRPLLGGALALFMLSLAGIPPLAGFWGKLFVLLALVRAGHGVLAVIAIISSAISLYYYLRVVAALYTRPDAEPQTAPPGLDRWGAAAALVAGVLTLALGIFPAFLYRLAESSLP